MPNDPYQIGEDNSGITLVLADRGTSVAVPHKDTHVTGGTDEIRAATISQNGLMTAAHATKLANIAENADVTSAAGIVTAFNTLTSAEPANADTLVFRDDSASNALKTVTLTNFITYLGGSLVGLSGTQSITGNKTFSGDVEFASVDINGGFIGACTIGESTIRLSGTSTNTFIGQLPVASGGTGVATNTGTGSVVLSTSPTLVTPVLGTPAAGSVLTNCTGLPLEAGTIGTLTIAKGGTGVTALASGVVKSNGTVLSTSAVDLTSAEVTGALPVTKGGTGVATLTAGVVRASGTSAFTTGAVSLTSEVSGVLPITNGGTSFSQASYGQISSRTPVGTSVAYTNTFTKVDMATTLGSPSSNFSSASSSSSLTYTGTQTRDFLVYASLDMLGDTAGDGYAIRLAKNGADIPETECQAYAAGKSPNFYAKLVTSWIITLNPNDYLELFAASPPATPDNGFPQRMRLIATPV